MELIIELIVWVVIEVIFWGILYRTGYMIIKAVTIGQWKLAYNEGYKENKNETKSIVVALIGALFWIGLGTLIVIIT